MFQLISILIVIVLVIGGVYSAYTYFIAEKESAGSTKPEPTTSPVVEAVTIRNPSPSASDVNPQITDAVTQAPKKAKKKRYYHSKPKAKAGAKPARFKQTLSKKNLDKIKRVKGK
jgi:hypothetical protein